MVRKACRTPYIRHASRLLASGHPEVPGLGLPLAQPGRGNPNFAEAALVARLVRSIARAGIHVPVFACQRRPWCGFRSTWHECLCAWNYQGHKWSPSGEVPPLARAIYRTTTAFDSPLVVAPRHLRPVPRAA
jgi:hypothetical protein